MRREWATSLHGLLYVSQIPPKLRATQMKEKLSVNLRIACSIASGSTKFTSGSISSTSETAVMSVQTSKRSQESQKHSTGELGWFTGSTPSRGVGTHLLVQRHPVLKKADLHNVGHRHFQATNEVLFPKLSTCAFKPAVERSSTA